MKGKRCRQKHMLNLPGWQDVSIVDVLDERLDLGLPLDGLLVHGAGDLTWGNINPSHQSMRELLVAGAIIYSLDDYGFLSSVAPRQDHYDLPRLDATRRKREKTVSHSL